MKKRIIQFLLSLLVAVCAFIPSFMFWGARSLLSPEGFWQNFFVFGVGIYFLGAAQVLFLGVAIGFIYIIWKRKG